MVKIALIGDVHTLFDEQDVSYFNQSDYDLVLFVGDLARYRYREGFQTARVISKLRKTAVLIPGNHDTMVALQLLAEARHWPLLKWLTAFGQSYRFRQVQRALAPVELSSYAVHPFQIEQFSFDLITARPLSFGESWIAYKYFLQKQYGIDSIAASAAKLKACVDQAQSDRLIFLAHTGPRGLSHGRADIWGIDYKQAAGDNGDRDLQEAIAYAKAQGKQVMAVVAGHMHHCLKKGGQRQWHLYQDDTHYVNAAYVPRIFEQNGRLKHHYIQLIIDEGETAVLEAFH